MDTRVAVAAGRTGGVCATNADGAGKGDGWTVFRGHAYDSMAVSRRTKAGTTTEG